MAAPRTLHLQEHRRLKGVQLTADEIELLDDPRARLQVFARPDGAYDIGAAEVVGTFEGRGTRVVISPKVPVQSLLFLLGFAADLLSFTSRTELDAATDAMDAMAAVYAEALARALRDGALNSYEPRREDLRQPRGRIDSLDLVRKKFGVFPPLASDFHEFTPDNDANQCLLAAASLLLRSGAASPTTARRLAALCSHLADVTDVRTSWRPRTRPVLDHRFDRYGPALALADVILRHGAIELRDGHTDSVGMLVDMNKVYEAFVAEGLRETIGDRPELWERQPQGLSLDVGGRLLLAPDVVWRSANANRLVIDAKYKDTRAAKNADVYQLVAYCQGLGLKRGALVYASVREETFVVRHGGPEIRVFELDPNGTPDQLRTRLRELAEKLRLFAN